MADRPTDLDFDVLVEITERAQSLLEHSEIRLGGGTRSEVKKGNASALRPLRAGDARQQQCPRGAQNETAGRRCPAAHSITSSALTRSDCGTVRPSALAVFRLITNSNLVGCSTGRSAGLAPFKILSTYPAAFRNESRMFGP